MGRPCKEQFRRIEYLNRYLEKVSIDLGEENNSKSKKPKHPKCKKPKQAINAQTTNTNVVCPQANIIGGNTNFETSEQLVCEEQFFYFNYEDSFFEEGNDSFFPFD